jgi:hypothetical protein
MIETALHTLILADSRFIDLAGTRLYPTILPDEPQLPAVTYQRITTRRDYTTTGPVSLDRVRLQFDLWASTYSQTKQLQAALLAILEDRSLYAATAIDSIQLDMATDGYEHDARLYRVSMDFIAFVNE